MKGQRHREHNFPLLLGGGRSLAEAGIDDLTKNLGIPAVLHVGVQTVASRIAVSENYRMAGCLTISGLGKSRRLHAVRTILRLPGCWKFETRLCGIACRVECFDEEDRESSRVGTGADDTVPGVPASL